MAAYRGELEVVVTSSEPLDSKAMQRLDKALKATQMAEGKTLKIVNRVSIGSLIWGKGADANGQVNPGVLGGLLVDFGDKTSSSSTFG